ncbi:aldehyde ferredoxin oxidoreductase family protein [Desulfoferrobacter suflitae]|uniref:aldehyde ferredoxin oxidoreductase family protein n=1 Tax=Desulfoferrobacter suflitae TaxID=2865782 RepID=UPI0021644806|nr:aldehyde ferredoxin oxidoreductase family protein [Desulfoferrobacter suflitae]MCK8603022.1 aldehyde ferredoxin oxidoreductase family protein [Desulfoferrobacter suflitae]
MQGFYNRILTVDVTDMTWRVDQPDEATLGAHLGGKGLAIQLLLAHNPPQVEPLSPENHLIFANGPVSGSPVWGCCRHGVYTKSPQTGFFSESYSGGTVAEHICASGFDAVMLRGAADGPVWLEVSPEGVAFHSAEELWGLDTFATEDRIKEWVLRHRPETGKCGVICIGPGGENQVSFAVIENDYWRSAGRTGVGAVMGAKKVKAIAFHGKSKKQFADPELLKNFAKTLAQIGRDNPGVKAYKSMGTPMLVDIMNEAGGFPTRYWSKGRSELREQFNAAALHSRCEVEPHACLKCFMACGRLSTVKEGRHKGLKIEGPEYETIFAFGGLCEIAGIEEIAYLNDICDRLGIDTITAGNLAGLAIEAARRGKIEHPVDYGKVDEVARLLEDIAYRRGIGEVLAQGIKHAARQWGMEDQAIHVKGLEPAGYDPRILKGMGLAYGTSDRGACHLRATFYKPELSGMVDRDGVEGKARVFTEWEDRLTIFDTLVLCRFYRDLYQWEQLAEMIKGATGLALDVEAMRRIAAGVSDAVRRFNLREGLTRQDDLLPARFHQEALPETGKVITQEQMEQMLREYYQARGWNEHGEPPAA